MEKYLMQTINQPASNGQYADVEGARLYYEVAGAGRPLVLVHAGIADSRMWDAQWDVFARHYQVIRYDMRGFGRSEMPPAAFSHHQDLYGLLNHLGIGPVALLAASFGGRVAIDFTLAYPDLVSALVLVDSALGGHDWSEEVQRFGAAEEAALEQGDLAAATDLNVRMWVDGPHRSPDQVDPAIRERIREMQLRAFMLDTPGAEYRPLDPPAAGRLDEIHAPTLALVGDQDVGDILTIADLLAAQIAGARKALIAGAAHLPSMEQPDPFNQVVLDFLRAA
jgi:3-oxoadipate enol-lactonase